MSGNDYPPPPPGPSPDGRPPYNPYKYIIPDYWDEYADERDILLLVLVLIDRRGMRRHVLHGLRDEDWEEEQERKKG